MVSVQDSFDDVAIFWDYENCTPPCSVPGYDVVNNIREVAHAYGSVKLFKAYLELAEQSSSKSIGLRSELQSCGVSLTDCPHNGRKDVADKMMIVDMLTYAIDNPAPATIVLISGDRDFVYAVSVLRLRRYRVVLVAPNTAHASLKSQATTVLDWESDIMRRSMRPQTFQAFQPEMYETLLQRSPRRPPLSLGGPLPQPAPRSARRPSFKGNTPLTPVTPLDVSNRPRAGSFFQARHLRNPSIVTTDESLPPNAGCRCEANHERVHGLSLMGDVETTAGCTPIQDIVEVMRCLEERQGTLSPSNRASPEMSSTNSPSPSATSTSSVNPPAPDSSQMGAAIAPTDNPIKAEVIGMGPQREEDAVAAHSHNLNLVAPKPVAFAPMGCEPVLRPPTAGSLVTHSNGIPSSRTVSPTRLEAEETVRYISSQSESDSTNQLTTSEQAVEELPTSPSIFERLPPVEHACVSPDVSATNRALGGQLPQSMVQPDEAVAVSHSPGNMLAWVPAHFYPLMQVLEEMRLGGSEQPLRTTVAVRLLQVAKDIYKGSGKGSFKEYSTAAATVGLVVLGGVKGYAWISLSPEWHGKVPVTTSRC